ncbi:restriction modification system DNA specificity domain-containing protein [Bifidobacterium reuteri DSM 23975]|uniref:Restriction modification system DNA specificity domain-containing protein n=1 Tax=Bifidobacterium reuteri DSM 23975 TaxID=1437610 RepID=A0A087CVB2_9BIFI|nr:restriction endonuclease subunit S [Bifidobacterium reuteri]KFI87212.1 restriction modification system DNA specificity domain-containing protein [Bifidobacterium reuteri DSM 23975]
MGERTVVRLGDVCHIVSGTTPNSTKPEYWDGGLPWVTPAEISNDSHIITDTQRTLTEAGVLSKKLPLLPKGTVLLSSRAPIGKVAIAGRDMYCNQGFKNLICSDAIFNEYLYCFLKSQNKRLQHMGHGATFKELSKKTLSDMMIPVPSLDVQHEIVSTLEAASRLTDVAKQMLDKADELIQSRFVEMFGDIQERTTVSHYVKSFSSGKSLASKERCINLVLKTSAVASNTFDETQIKYLPFDYVPNPDHEIKHGDVIINRKNTVQLVGSTGYVWQYPKNMYLSDLLWKANLDETTCNPIFLWQLLVNRSVHRRISAMATGANSSMANITKPNLMQLPVVLVPLALQNEFAEFVTQVESLKACIRQQLDRLNTLYDSLAQSYFAE